MQNVDKTFRTRCKGSYKDLWRKMVFDPARNVFTVVSCTSAEKEHRIRVQIGEYGRTAGEVGISVKLHVMA
jgi:hypothetical protein